MAEEHTKQHGNRRWLTALLALSLTLNVLIGAMMIWHHVVRPGAGGCCHHAMQGINGQWSSEGREELMGALSDTDNTVMDLDSHHHKPRHDSDHSK